MGGRKPDPRDLFDALENALVEGTPVIALQRGCIWIDGEVAFDAQRVLDALTARDAAVLDNVRPEIREEVAYALRLASEGAVSLEGR